MRLKTYIMFKKGLKGNLFIKNGFKIEIKEENKDILKKLGADVFSKTKKKESENNK